MWKTAFKNFEVIWSAEADHTAQKKKFCIKDFFSKCDQIRSLLRIWSHWLKKCSTENFFFVQCERWCKIWNPYESWIPNSEYNSHFTLLHRSNRKSSKWSLDKDVVYLKDLGYLWGLLWALSVERKSVNHLGSLYIQVAQNWRNQWRN